MKPKERRTVTFQPSPGVEELFGLIDGAGLNRTALINDAIERHFDAALAEMRRQRAVVDERLDAALKKRARR